MMKSAFYLNWRRIRSVFKAAGFLLIGVTGLHSQNSDKWIQQTSATTKNLYDVFFTDANTGWVVGQSGTVRKTTNGGDVWISQNSKTSNSLHAMFFIDSQKGWAVGENGTVIHTSNGGNDWSPQSINTTSLMKSVHFVNDSTGWVCGDSFPSVFKTTDGGNNWFSPTSGEYRSNSLFFIDNNVGWIAGPGVSKTLNGGDQWTPCNVDLNSHAVYFINANTGWVVGSPFDAFRTDDGGTTWSPLAIESCLWLNDVFFTDSNHGWTVGDGIFRTMDGGIHWDRVHPGAGFSAVRFVDPDTGWVVGENGIILKTETGGATTVRENMDLKKSPSGFSLSQNYPNPFNPVTTIEYSVKEPCRVLLKVCDIHGHVIASLVDEYRQSGRYKVGFDARHLPTGLYFYRIRMKDFFEVRKMTVVK